MKDIKLIGNNGPNNKNFQGNANKNIKAAKVIIGIPPVTKNLIRHISMVAMCING